MQLPISKDRTTQSSIEIRQFMQCVNHSLTRVGKVTAPTPKRTS